MPFRRFRSALSTIRTGTCRWEPWEKIVCRGYKVMKGYWNNPKATEEALRGGWLHTGDLAFMEEDGYLYLSGRKKDMIIRGGGNIYPVEIENALHAHPKVQEAAVIGVPDEVWGEIVKAVIVLKPGATSTPRRDYQLLQGETGELQEASACGVPGGAAEECHAEGPQKRPSR